MEGSSRPPGLRFNGNRPIWRASKAAVAKGYPVKSANLSIFASDPQRLADRCNELQQEMLEWIDGKQRKAAEFDGTFNGLFDLYENDKRSPYPKLQKSTRQPYGVYIRMMRAEIGHCHIDNVDGRDVQDWFDSWMKPGRDGKPMVAKARMAIAVLKAALAYGIVCRKPGCADFRAAMPKKFKVLPPRKWILTAAQIVAARKAAMEDQHPGAALAYALQFEGAIRQIDVIGKWVPLSDPRPSAIHYKGKKWLGPTWERNVDANLILRFKPTKTENTSEEEVAIDLRACPMVMEELEMTLQGTLSGPLIIDRKTGRPYQTRRYEQAWRRAAKAAGIPTKVWNRDIRKSGSTEARAAGAMLEDVKKVMGHTPDTETTSNVYDMAQLEAHRRVAAVRTAHRSKKTGA